MCLYIAEFQKPTDPTHIKGEKTACEKGVTRK